MAESCLTSRSIEASKPRLAMCTAWFRSAPLRMSCRMPVPARSASSCASGPNVSCSAPHAGGPFAQHLGSATPVLFDRVHVAPATGGVRDRRVMEHVRRRHHFGGALLPGHGRATIVSFFSISGSAHKAGHQRQALHHDHRHSIYQVNFSGQTTRRRQGKSRGRVDVAAGQGVARCLAR